MYLQLTKYINNPQCSSHVSLAIILHTNVTTINWRPSLYNIDRIAAGVKVHHNTYTMPYLLEKKLFNKMACI